VTVACAAPSASDSTGIGTPPTRTIERACPTGVPRTVLRQPATQVVALAPIPEQGPHSAQLDDAQMCPVRGFVLQWCFVQPASLEIPRLRTYICASASEGSFGRLLVLRSMALATVAIWPCRRETNDRTVDVERTEGQLAPQPFTLIGRHVQAAWRAAFTRPSASAVRPISNCSSLATCASASSTLAVNGKSS
jgi:hypothetical protein